MTLASELIEQAEHLVRREPKKPKQASLRRAVSAAYYALFHELVSDAALKFVPNDPPSLRLKVRRVLGHGEMNAVCEQFAKPSAGSFSPLVSTPLESEIARVAAAFVDLQENRHRADYDVSEPIDRLDADFLVKKARTALRDWRSVRHAPNANVFLGALLFHSRWNKK